MAISKTFLQETVNTADLSVYTFSAQNLGSATIDRFIVLGVYGREISGGSTSITSITVGGIAATQNTFVSNSGSHSALYCVKIPTGTTGDVVVTWANTMTVCKIALWRITGISSTTAFDSFTNTSTPTTGTIDCGAGGLIVGYGTTDINPVEDATWTGLVEDFEETDTFNSSSGASLIPETVQTNLTVTCDWITESRQMLNVISFDGENTGNFFNLM